MSMYLLIANILLINLLIAVFNNIFNETNSISHQVWMFQRFTVVMEYQQKPFLPPPLIAICHFYSLIKYCFRKAKGLQEVRDNGLKLFLEKDDMEKVYDFEEECVEGFFQEQNTLLLQSTEERIKNTDERVENMTQKIEDINTKENLQALSIQNMEFRLRRMEESTEQILSHLAVIHRFMSTHINSDVVAPGSVVNLSTFPQTYEVQRNRTMSENDSANMLLPSAAIPITFPATTRIRKFNRSLTEVRPDAYIFDDGAHLEVRTVLEENELMQSSEEINEYSVSVRSRKLSVQSEEPEYCISPPPTTVQQQQQSVLTSQESAVEAEQPIMRSDSITRRSLSFRQDTAKSEESKDTLTPLDGCEERTLIGVENAMPSATSAAASTAIDDTDRQRFGLRRRNSQLGRRNSESQSQQVYDINRSQNSLNIVGMPKRQFSLTQSEPDTDDGVAGVGGVGRTKPTGKAGRHLLLQIHAEYTSITDELESMITSPTNSLMDEKPKKIDQLTNPEFAALLEKQHLKECEDNDYMVMEELLTTRSGSSDECDDTIEGNFFNFSSFSYEQPISFKFIGGFASDYTQRRMLRRETAIELPVTPSKLQKASEQNQEFQISNERRAVSADNPPSTSRSNNMSYLIPDTDQQRHNKKPSNESLQKNSSSDNTDYSAHPYHVIKQNSNDTNSSFNIDNSSFTNDLSLEADSMQSTLNSTVIENTAATEVFPKRASTISATDNRANVALLRKQYSVDHHHYRGSDGMSAASAKRPLSENLEKAFTLSENRSPAVAMKISPRIHMNVLKESSSTSTEDTREDARKMIPSISTHLVQDEIAKLSLNIKSSVEEDEVSRTIAIDDNAETMC